MDHASAGRKTENPGGGKSVQDESGFTLLETWVPSAKAYRESATRQIPVYQLDDRRRGASPCGAEVMEGLARELLAGDAPDSVESEPVAAVN